MAKSTSNAGEKKPVEIAVVEGGFPVAIRDLLAKIEAMVTRPTLSHAQLNQAYGLTSKYIQEMNLALDVSKKK